MTVKVIRHCSKGFKDIIHMDDSGYIASACPECGRYMDMVIQYPALNFKTIEIPHEYYNQYKTIQENANDFELIYIPPDER